MWTLSELPIATERERERGGERERGEVVWRIQTATIGFFFPTLKIRKKELQRSTTLNTGCISPPHHHPSLLSPSLSLLTPFCFSDPLSRYLNPLPPSPLSHTFSSGGEINSHKLIILPWAVQRRRRRWWWGRRSGGARERVRLESYRKVLGVISRDVWNLGSLGPHTHTHTPRQQEASRCNRCVEAEATQRRALEFGGR